jgi:hypothetical protein
MRRGFVAFVLAVLSLIGVFVYSNLRPDTSLAVSPACRQERLQGHTCAPPPSEAKHHLESSIG